MSTEVTQNKNRFNVNDAVKLAAATGVFAMSLVGLHFNVEYSGWGIVIAVFLAWNVVN